MRVMTESPDFAWACGLFEGEGCIHHRPAFLHGEPRVKLDGEVTKRREISLGTTDLDVLQRFHAAVGGVGYIVGPSLRPPHKPLWRWRMSKWADMAPLLERMLPFLGERRSAKALELLADAPRDPHAPRVTHCPLGHAYEGDNLLINGGKRQCRTCRRRQWREWRERKKAAAA